MPFHLNIDTERLFKSADRAFEVVSTTIMTLLAHLTSFTLSFTISRIALTAILLPLYLYKLMLSMLPSVIRNSFNVLTPGGWSSLVAQTDQYRSKSDTLAHEQLEGSYKFKPDEVFHVDRNSRGWMESVPWANDTEEFDVCGATVRYIHLKPSYSTVLQDGKKSHRPIVFLHGGISWSYMWRNVFPSLLEQGHEIYAIDWLGHGRSDKILRPDAITFELHICTLTRFFEVTELEDAIVAAHEWGGCVVLCTLPRLPSTSATSLFLLNTFFPPRLSDCSLHYRLLNRIWYCVTGLLHGYTPESAYLRFLSPSIQASDITNYTSAYKSLPRSSKSSIERFAHLPPSLPRFLLFTLRNTFLWKAAEGFLGPSHFETLNTQARLSAQDDQVRRYWSTARTNSGDENGKKTEVAVVFGERDPLVRDYKNVLVRTIHPDRMAKWAPRGIWVEKAGHLAVEEKAAEVAGLVGRFARG
ncbi:Alpha/Beta hydrolase protein [Aspergillus karnatakaensis]|uniref:haloalkane dehalogenase family protein n=1 Tax=Aspergillus karnatakaensis TaxID=1810916 RepID=UPI003CCD5BFF